MSAAHSSSKRRKVDVENRQFNDEWSEKYFCEPQGTGARCLVCDARISVCKEYNIKRHFQTHHEKKMASLVGEERSRKFQALSDSHNQQRKAFSSQSRSNAAAVRASFRVASVIAAHGRPFSDGELVRECLLEVADEVSPESVAAFKAVSLSTSTVTRRVEDIADDLTAQLAGKTESFSNYSIALDESTDISDTAQLLIFVRGVDVNFNVTEELLGLSSLKGQTTGKDIFDKLKETVAASGLSWNKLCSVTTDGAPNMTGSKMGLVARIRRHCEEQGFDNLPVSFHCIVHQQALASTAAHFADVMKVVTDSVNYIRSRGLKHRQFQEFLNSVEAEYTDVLYYTQVRWLSRGTVLQRFFNLRHEIRQFMEEQGRAVAELTDFQWISQLAFLVDVTQLLNTLNRGLQGKEQLICHMYRDVKAFGRKLELLISQLQQDSWVHFACCSELQKTEGYPMDANLSLRVLTSLHEQFSSRFSDFHSIAAELRLLQNPFAVDVDTCDASLQMELIELQADECLRDTYNRDSSDLVKFYK